MNWPVPGEMQPRLQPWRSSHPEQRLDQRACRREVTVVGAGRWPVIACRKRSRPTALLHFWTVRRSAWSAGGLAPRLGLKFERRGLAGARGCSPEVRADTSAWMDEAHQDGLQPR